MRFYRSNLAWDVPPVAAMQVGQDTLAEICVWTHGVAVKELKPGEDPEEPDSWLVGVNVPAVGGMARASEGDFVIRDMAGAFHIMRAFEFNNKFTEVVVERPSPSHINVREMRAQNREARDG